MKLFTLLAFLGCLMFNTVEDINTVQDESMTQTYSEMSADLPESLDDRNGCIMPIGPITFSGFGCENFGLCLDNPFPYPTFPVAEYEFNQASGNASLDENGTVNLKIDGNTFSMEYRQQILEDPTFGLENDFTIPQELVNELYSCSGQEAPVGLVIPKGTYAAKKTPWGLLLSLLDIEVDIDITIEIHIDCC